MGYNKVTQTYIKSFITSGAAVDITGAGLDDYCEILKRENGFDIIAMSRGVNGVNGLLIRGDRGGLYAIGARSTAIFIFL